MKYFLGDNVQIDSFSDGECVVYDGNNEMMHSSVIYVGKLYCKIYSSEISFDESQSINKSIWDLRL